MNVHPASRLSLKWIIAIRISASPVAGSPSSSVLNRLLRPSQAQVHSTILRVGRTAQARTPAGVVTISITQPPVSSAHVRPRQELPRIAAIRPDQREPREPPDELGQPQLHPLPVLDICRMDGDGEHASS